MRVSEIYEATAKLGFEDSLEDHKAFYYALNRAVLQVNAIRPRIASYEIFHRPLLNCVPESERAVREVLSEMEIFADRARAYYFEAMGAGTYRVYVERKETENKESEETESEPWVLRKEENFEKNGFTAFSGFITNEDGTAAVGRVKLVFCGNYVFTVRNVALYENIYSPDEEKIPAFCEYSKYDLSLLTSDFLSFEEKPIELDGYTVMSDEYDIENESTVVLPYYKRGIFKVKYRRRPAPIKYGETPEEDDTVIDLDDELASLLPSLVAAYVWLDDEPSKAQIYMSLYQERAMDVERRIKNVKPAAYVTNGW